MIVWLEIELNKVDFGKLCDHIDNNMFFGVKRIGPNLQHVVFHSIGDDLIDTEDSYDITRSEIFIEKKIEDKKLSKEALANIISDKNWYLKFVYGNTMLSIVVDKISGYITYRKLRKDG